LKALHINGNDLTLEEVREVADIHARQPVLLAPDAREPGHGLLVSIPCTRLLDLPADHDLLHGSADGIGDRHRSQVLPDVDPGRQTDRADPAAAALVAVGPRTAQASPTAPAPAAFTSIFSGPAHARGVAPG